MYPIGKKENENVTDEKKKRYNNQLHHAIIFFFDNVVNNVFKNNSTGNSIVPNRSYGDTTKFDKVFSTYFKNYQIPNKYTYKQLLTSFFLFIFFVCIVVTHQQKDHQVFLD